MEQQKKELIDWLANQQAELLAQVAVEESGGVLDTDFLGLYESKAKERVELDAKLFCTNKCSLHGSGIQHEHYEIHPKIVGLLKAFDSFILSRSDDEILIDFEKLDGDGKLIRQNLIKNGLIFNAYAPAQLFGQACGLTIRQIRAFQAILRERTRGIPRGVESCLTRKGLVENATVPGKRGKGSLRCPLLEPDVQYVAFGGNIKSNFGRGYQVVGALTATSLGGWVRRFGYPVRKEDGAEQAWKCAKAMFGDLKILTTEFGFVVAFLGADGQWEDLDTAIEIARGPRQVWLNKAAMRIFVPADYLTVWRSWFAKKLGFSYIPGGAQSQPSECSPDRLMSKERAIAILKRTGIPLGRQLAARIRCDASTVGRQISGKSKMSKPLLLQLLSLDKLQVAK